MHKDYKELVEYLDKKFGRVDERFEEIDKRFNKLFEVFATKEDLEMAVSNLPTKEDFNVM